MKTSGIRTRKTKTSSGNKKAGGSWCRTIVELIFFVVWLLFTGIAGYFVGYNPSTIDCPDIQQELVAKPVAIPEVKSKCNPTKVNAISGGGGIAAEIPLFKDGGFTYDELKAKWMCSHAEGNNSDINQQILPEGMDLSKTKWKSVLTVEPKAFFKKYLSQYPGDTRAVQPVLVFSHKPLNNLEEVPEVCKVMDVAIVPDKPGVCVAVTETFHDVASYHMLHADRQPDGSFALTANSLEGRVLPTQAAYASARALLIDFFRLQDYVSEAMTKVPKYDKGRVCVGTLVEDTDDLEHYLNALASASKPGISKNKFVVFTTNKDIQNDLKNTKVHLIYLPNLAKVGTQGDANVGPKLRRFFLQAWLAFAVANNLIKMMWVPPSTVWFDRPDNIVHDQPIVESLWGYKGRKDPRAAPFFVSFDFMVPLGVERPIHLLHEIVLHFDLVITWDSLDAVASYRLSENNSRYGTTTAIIPPYKVLHSELMEHDASKIKDAVTGSEPPLLTIFPKNFDDPQHAKKVLSDAGLWYI